jgi:hypothetical protein
MTGVKLMTKKNANTCKKFSGIYQKKCKFRVPFSLAI